MWMGMLNTLEVDLDRAAVEAAIVPRFVGATARFVALSGGRSNGIWRVEDRHQCVIAKLYRPGRSSDLFPNDAQAEHIALKALKNSGLAPDLLGKVQTERGPCVLYSHVKGASLAPTAEAFERAGISLAKLHQMAPAKGLREIPFGASAMLEMARGFLEGAQGDEASQLRARIDAVEAPKLDNIPPVFLHGDVVPGNIMDGPAGIVLIDWQCPAKGDPCEDLATFLSPAMQSLYGAGPISQDLEAAFLRGYGNAQVEARYRALAPLFHLRMAAYCLWQTGQGEADYLAAARLELAAL
jgi:thiamine kinase